jgi:vacuolar-type H+-ATPase subunit E/Vma4
MEHLPILYELASTILTGLILFVVASAILAIKCRFEIKRRKREIENLKYDFGIEKSKLKQKIVKAKEDFSKTLLTTLEIENVSIISQAISSQDAKLLVNKFKTILEQKFNGMSQEFFGSLSDETEGLIRDTQIELSEKVWDSFQQMKEKQDDSPYVIPRNARIAYTKGNRTVVVIEQEPQVRTMQFTSGLLKDHEKKAASVTPSGFRYRLALPYVYFFIVFDNGNFSYIEVYFRNKAIQSVKNSVYCATIPNIHHSESYSRLYSPVCLGPSFSISNSSSISVQCEEVITYFWQSSFSGDLGKVGQNDGSTLDPRISNYKVWQEESDKDPLFILDVKWPNGATVKGLIEKLFEKRGSHPLNNLETQIKKSLDEGVKKITNRITKEINRIKNERVKSEEWISKINPELETVIRDHTKKVFEVCRKQTYNKE